MRHRRRPRPSSFRRQGTDAVQTGALSFFCDRRRLRRRVWSCLGGHAPVGCNEAADVTLAQSWEQLGNDTPKQRGIKRAAGSTRKQLPSSARCGISGFGNNGTVSIARSRSRPGEDRVVWSNFVLPGYFQTIGQKLLVGRDFTDRDRRGPSRVAVINQSMARYFFGDESPIGRLIGRHDQGGRSPLSVS